MLLALDVGNTNITLGVYEGEKLLFVTRMATNPPRMEDEYASAMLSILHLYNIHTSQVNGAVLSSVVPRLTDDLARAVRRVWKVEPFIVSAQSVPELKVKRDVPNTLGADLVVGAVAAKAMYHGPCIVIDMGTATTLTGLNADGEVCGVVIIPGVGTSLDALTSRAAQLSSVSLTAPPQVLGRNTMECIQSGMVFGTACMLDGLCDRIDELAELGLGLTLSISLHAPTNQIRSSMMPVNDAYPLEQLIPACRRYQKETGRRISFEYSMVRGVNDSSEMAQKLADLIRGMGAHVNLIPINPVDGSPYSATDDANVHRFQKELEALGVNATVRRRLGTDISAACGQLRREDAQGK